MMAFEALFGLPARAVAEAPGRVNMLGEHTDYNAGFVLPTVIPRHTRVAVAVSPEGVTRVRSAQFAAASATEAAGFARYVEGCRLALGDYGLTLPAICAYVDSSVPIGKGLSSSAALEVATLRALRRAFDLNLDDVTLARIALRAENQYAGVSCGIMDQMAVSLGVLGHMLFLDTRGLETKLLPFPAGSDMCVLDSGTERSLIDTPYNERRRECELAASALAVRSLRELTDPRRVSKLPARLQRRARHVLSENERVLQASRGASAEQFGRLMNASHASLRDDFEVSCRSLDVLVDLLQHHPWVYGARLTGAGFGGACIALVRSGTAPQVSESVLSEYSRLGYQGTWLV
jgi:galactokinase